MMVALRHDWREPKFTLQLCNILFRMLEMAHDLPCSDFGESLVELGEWCIQIATYPLTSVCSNTFSIASESGSTHLQSSNASSTRSNH